MSERKVLTKYYPPDFDPSKLTKRVKKDPTQAAKLPTVRLMAPFSMKCLSCGEFIYKGRKFNARKENLEERYLTVAKYQFHIRCVRCSAPIAFKTDPKNMDYEIVAGATRNYERWRDTGDDAEAARERKLETEEEMLDRLETEAAMANAEGGSGAMAELEAKVLDAKTEMEIADALDSIRTRNARIARVEGKGDAVDEVLAEREERVRREEGERERIRLEREDEEAARRAFGRWDGEDAAAVATTAGDSQISTETGMEQGVAGPTTSSPDQSSQFNISKDSDTATLAETLSTEPVVAAGGIAPPSFKRMPKKKKDFSAALGIKKKASLV